MPGDNEDTITVEEDDVLTTLEDEDDFKAYLERLGASEDEAAEAAERMRDRIEELGLRESNAFPLQVVELDE